MAISCYRSSFGVQGPEPSKGRILLLLGREHGDGFSASNRVIGEVVGLEGVVDAQDLLAHPAAALHGELEQLGDLFGRGIAIGVNDLHQAGEGLLNARLIAGGHL